MFYISDVQCFIVNIITSKTHYENHLANGQLCFEQMMVVLVELYQSW